MTQATDYLFATLVASLSLSHETMRQYGVTVITPKAYKDFARYLWGLNRKPKSVYRGGRWRQMGERAKVSARLWAILKDNE